MARARTTVRIEMNSPGHRALLRSQPILALTERSTNAIAAAAGEGFVVTSAIGSNRARSSVSTATPEARRAEAVDKRLTTSLDRGRF